MNWKNGADMAHKESQRDKQTARETETEGPTESPHMAFYAAKIMLHNGTHKTIFYQDQ
jgi:hypothetical protein